MVDDALLLRARGERDVDVSQVSEIEPRTAHTMNAREARRRVCALLIAYIAKAAAIRR